MDHTKVYPFTADITRQNGELDLYRESNRLNRECARAIDEAIKESNYKLYHYDLKTAAKKVVDGYGTDRVAWVLANTVQCKSYDGRFSWHNKEWAKAFAIPEQGRTDFITEVHPYILDGFINHARKELAEREKPYDHLAAVEMSVEQGYSHIDGMINNEKPKEDIKQPSLSGKLQDLKKECTGREKSGKPDKHIGSEIEL